MTGAARPLRILGLIDHFGSGGAQRQMVALARGLHARGHRVELFIYFPEHDFFRAQVESAGIPIHEVRKAPGFSFGVLRAVAALLRRGGYDVVLSYLDSPNVYAELAHVWGRGPRLVVSERSSHRADGAPLAAFGRRLLHGLADHVVANSEAHADWLRGRPWLARKVSCIYNGLDLAAFDPRPLVPADPADVRLLAIGRAGPEKNLLNLIRALDFLQRTTGRAPAVSWVGKRDSRPAGQRYMAEVDALLDRLPAVRARWTWLGERADVPQLLAQHHALIHPSLYEGLPNVVCEALAAGRPVLASAVCDHPRLVEPGERGFLFDPADPQSIADAIRRLEALDADGWRRLSAGSRRFAESALAVERMVAHYEDLFERLAAAPRAVAAGRQ